MLSYEYKVIPAPKKAGKVKGIKGTDLNFAAALAEVMNRMGRAGWEYQRTDTLPCEERQGFTGRTTTFQNMLIFRKIIDEPVEMSVRTPTEIPATVQTPEPAAEPAMAVRSSVAEAAGPALAAATHDAPQGHAPRIGKPTAHEPAKIVPAPGIAAQ